MPTITEQPARPGDAHTDWVAWLRTDDGIHIRIQIGYQASETRARAIIATMAGVAVPPEPKRKP